MFTRFMFYSQHLPPSEGSSFIYLLAYLLLVSPTRMAAPQEQGFLSCSLLNPLYREECLAEQVLERYV